MKDKVIIIGAGLTGLSAGIYLQQAGYASEIFELSGQAGGMCTYWQRKGYTFDGCISWMVGTRPGTYIRRLYEETGALETDTPIYDTKFLSIEREGKTYKIPLDPDGFKAFIKSLAPEDDKKADLFLNYIDMVAKADLFLGAPQNIKEFFDMFKDGGKLLRLLASTARISVGDFVKDVKSAELKELLLYLMPADFTFFALIMMLGTRIGVNAGYPLGGAYGVVKRMVKKYQELGGKIHFNSKVDEILIEDGRARGVRVKDTVYNAGTVVAACDMYDTIYRMLGGKYNHPQLEKMLKEAPVFSAISVVSFGLDKKLGLPFTRAFELDKKIETSPGVFIENLDVRSLEFDAGSAPEGCSAVMFFVPSDYEYWYNLRNDDYALYKEKKAELAKAVAEAVEKQYPGFSDSVVLTDVATPATYVRYANLYKASFEGFLPIKKYASVRIKNTISGVKGLILAGQWLFPGGGLCAAIYNGKLTAKQVKKTAK